MGDYSAFFYGTLMVPEVLNRVCYGKARPQPEPARIKSRTITPALLLDHRRHRVRSSDYPAALPSEGSTVRGTFVTGLSAADIWRLDVFESRMYERVDVKVKLLARVDEANGKSHEEGDEVETQTYVWTEDKAILEENEWDFAEFQRDKLSRWTRERDEYTEVDEAVEAESHDPTGGRGANGKIGKELDELDAGELDDVVRSAV